jgi:hypothetical protein
MNAAAGVNAESNHNKSRVPQRVRLFIFKEQYESGNYRRHGSSPEARVEGSQASGRNSQAFLAGQNRYPQNHA